MTAYELIKETIYNSIKEKWKKKEMLAQANKKMNAFKKNETLAVINEKARMHNLTYGKYVLAREQGLYPEDKYLNIKLEHEHRFAWCKKTNHIAY